MNKYRTVIKSGRAFNGAHRDGGTIVHLIPLKEHDYPTWDKALCGVVPGHRGNGWHEVDRTATCEKCLKKQLKLNQ